MLKAFSFEGRIAPAAYAIAAPLLLLLQHAAVALCYKGNREPLVADAGFWLLPLRRLAGLDGLTSLQAALVFALAFAAAWALAVLSFRRASWAGRGHWLSLFAIFPVLQIAAIALLAILPKAPASEREDDNGAGYLVDVLQGVLAGVFLIVAAVLVSALTLGAYGWGLFVATPLIVGLTTGYIANRRVLRSNANTLSYVIFASALGGMALLMFALEGLICILLIAPLAIGAAMLGGFVGRLVARIGHHRGRPLLSVAFLPFLFVLEASMPPAASIATSERIDIAASPDAVWRSITSDRAIGLPPGLPALAGLAYPIGGRLLGEGVGAGRLGFFSTGVARERVTHWEKGRVLAFTVLSQPPAMEEMSPYRRVHAPHLTGYVVTGDTRYTLTPLPGGRTRLTLEAATVLHLDPIPYWEPIARWAFRANVRRVLASTRLQAEAFARAGYRRH